MSFEPEGEADGEILGEAFAVAHYEREGCGPASQYLFPVKQYSSASPNPECSAVGGYVYRGTRRPDLAGSYIYGDYCSGKIWKFAFDDPGISGDTLLIDSPYSISSFGEDEQGELYICNLNGSIHRFAGPVLPAAPTLVYPPDNSTTVPVPAHLAWRAIAGATGYRVQVATDSAFTLAVLDDSTLVDTAAVVSGLTIGTEYFWRVRARAAAGWGPPSASRRFVTTETVALQVPVPAGWSLVSVPVIAEDLSSPALFPDLAAGAFGFVGSLGYVDRDTLAYGEGYWVKYDSARVLALTGPPRRSDTVAVAPGWNLVGSLSVPIAAAGVTSLPPGILDSPFYSFTDAYVTADSLSPARGYWVKSTSTGSIVLQGPAVYRSDLFKP